MGGALVTTEDFDGDGALDLIASFNGTFATRSRSASTPTTRRRWRCTSTALAFNDTSSDRGRRGRGLAAGGQRRRASR